MISLYLVDDHHIMREGLRVLLQAWNYKVVGESADPTEALADIQRLKPDVLLLDLHLEGRSGFELMVEMRRRDLRTRCVILTMSAQPRMVAEALRMGALGYVLKGSPGAELSQAIESAAAGRRYLGASVAELAVQSFTQEQDQDPLESLSPRERQIIAMVVRGQSSTEIGNRLHLSPKTIATYRSRLMAKLGVSDVPALVRLAMRHELFEPDQP